MKYLNIYYKNIKCKLKKKRQAINRQRIEERPTNKGDT